MKNKKLIWTFAICLALIAISVVGKTFQNDTFFTIPTGNYILENGVNDVEPFTWHENLKFTKLRWCFDATVALVYRMAGFTGLYVLTVLIAIAIAISLFITLVKSKTNPSISFLITAFMILCSAGCLACRGQITSYLFFILEMYSINKLVETGKKKYSVYLIIISFLILGFHSSVWLAYYIFYLPYIAEWLMCKFKIKKVFEDTGKIIVEEKDSKIMKLLFITMGIAILTGFCTPLGLSPFTYMFKVIGGYSSKIIIELQKQTIFRTYQLYLTLGAVIGLLALTKTKIRITDIFFITGFMIMSRLAIRNMHIVLWVIAFPIARLITDFIETYNKKELFGKFEEKLNKSISFCIIVFLISVICAVTNYRSIYKQPYVDENKYPIEAAEYIKANLDLENIKIYNHFNNGSYLELKGIPTFIDSRSEVYCPEFNKGVSILEDMANFDIYNTTQPDFMVEKYGITHFLVQKNNVNASIMDNQKEKYKMIYTDDYYSIFEVINNKEA